ncbi:MGMT family protein [Echinicola sp. 20G]|uniref:MGMT family protein n=1 Tax=Echinicola sp. 20G TaxID=2781961 RepID=UPI001910FFCE|nr:MGMT family protein [Echinicola sp. 20G]
MKTDKENFFDLVYQVVRLIPRGRATSYGAIANYLGAKSGARTVGYAMNAAHTMDDVPAHRVVNRSGMLTGKHHFSPPEKMQEELEKEGIKVENDKIMDFNKVFWDPNLELGLDL